MSTPKNSAMIYKILLIFVLSQLFLFLNILGIGQNYVPEPRVGQAAVLIEDKIYYIGGYKFNQSQLTSDVFYLDVNEFKFIWTDLVSLGANLTLTSWHTASPNGISLDSIFILGGVHLDEANMNYVYKLDIKTNIISAPIIQGKTPQPRQGMNSAVGIEGKIYILGGYVGSGDNIIFVNSLDILDTINLSWSVGSLVNSPVGRIYYTATFLNDGTIYYIGGKVDRNNFSPMTEIYQYDTIGDKWSLKTATAEVAETMPGPRIGHTAVLLGSGKIIVYGGLYYNNDIPYGIPSKETIAMLDITTLAWSIPPLENFNNIPKLAFHSANLLYDVAMIITFGNNTDIPNSNNQYNRFIYAFLLVGQKYKWITVILDAPTKDSIKPKSKSEIPSPNISKTSPPQSNSHSKIIIVCVSIGSVAAGLTLFVASIFAYKRIKKNHKNQSSG
ncbi:unnamed protein product [Rhizophagus irregularis]|nr:unnamed protein product [Rhizophagus irregularis]